MSALTRRRLERDLRDGEVDLAAANLLIAAEAHPDLDADSALAHVEALAERARAEGVVETLRAEGFSGDTRDYDDPDNSLLDTVLARRRGLPIALATLTLAVAARARRPMAVIGLPGHFSVADLSGPAPAYLDPFRAWTPLDEDDCARLVRSTAGVDLHPDHLRPVGAREILGRTLANLRGSYLRRRRPADVLWTVELGLIVTPDDPSLVERQVVLLAEAGRYPEAERVAEGFLDRHPTVPAATRITAHLESVRDLRWRMN